jgi:hypothetical protein
LSAAGVAFLIFMMDSLDLLVLVLAGATEPQRKPPPSADLQRLARCYRAAAPKCKGCGQPLLPLAQLVERSVGRPYFVSLLFVNPNYFDQGGGRAAVWHFVKKKATPGASVASMRRSGGLIIVAFPLFSLFASPFHHFSLLRMLSVLRSPAEAVLSRHLDHRDLASLRLCCSVLRDFAEEEMAQERAFREEVMAAFRDCHALIRYRLRLDRDLLFEDDSQAVVWASVRAKAAELGMQEEQPPAQEPGDWLTFRTGLANIAVTLCRADHGYAVVHLRFASGEDHRYTLARKAPTTMVMVKCQLGDPFSPQWLNRRALAGGDRIPVGHLGKPAQWCADPSVLPVHLVTLPVQAHWSVKAIGALFKRAFTFGM